MRLLALVVLAMTAAAPASALIPPQVACADVAHNPDGSWAARKPMKLQDRQSSLTLAPGDVIPPGHRLGGLVLTDDLSRRCQVR